MFEEELKRIIKKKDYNNIESNSDDINFLQNFKIIYTNNNFNKKFIFLFVTLLFNLYIYLYISKKIKNKNLIEKKNIINQTDIYRNNISIINNSINNNINSNYKINKNNNTFFIENNIKNKEFNISEINNEFNISKLMQFYNISNKIIINNINIKLEKEKTTDSSLINNKFLIKNEKIEFKNIQEEINNYYKFNNNKVELKNKEYFYEIKEPKISLVITIYNQDIFIKNIYKCIKNQSLIRY